MLLFISFVSYLGGFDRRIQNQRLQDYIDSMNTKNYVHCEMRAIFLYPEQEIVSLHPCGILSAQASIALAFRIVVVGSSVE